MRVFELAKKLNVNSKRILEVAEILGINVKTHQSSLSEEDVSKIIKYLKKNKRIGIVFNKTALTLIDAIKKGFKKRTFVTGLLFGLTAFTIYGFSSSNANDIVAEVEIIDTVEQIDVLTTTPVELIDQDISSPPLFTDANDATTTTVLPTTTTTVPVTTTTTVLPTTTTTVPVTTTTTVLPTTTTTVPVTTTTTVLPTTTTTVPTTCDDESFQPYTLYTITGEANTVMSCRNEQDALESGYVLTVNPAPPPPTTTTTTTIPVSTSYNFVNGWFAYDYTAAALDIDSNKNLYVTGAYRSTNQTIGSQQLPNYGSGDVFVYKLNDLGDLDWVKTYGNSSGMSVRDIAVDQNGNSIITGYFIGAIDFGTGTQTATGGGSTFVLKLDTNGETDWVLTSTSGLRFDSGYGVDTDSNGNIYVSGLMNSRTTNTVTSITFGSFTISATNSARLFYLKINSSGVVQWVKTLDYGWQGGASVFVDSQDNKYLSGRCLGTFGGGNPYVDGSRGTATFSNVDGDDIATLSCTSAVNFGEAFVIKLDSSDNYVWHWNDWSIYSGNTAVISNSNGDVFVSYWINYQQPDICGSSISGTTGSYYVLVKLDSTGTCQWFYKSENSVNQISHIMRLGVDSSNNIYMHSPTENGLATYFISVFNNEGVQQNSLNTYAHDFVFDTDDNIYLLKNLQVRKSPLADIE
ncbi:MAG: translation initiation factor IF-2 N-terminal domain-containing protein [Candidatus Actinomarina sp.]|nr:translation initiation factor IF-2 N-terminal domain-containing protein [Candidatus Actinomarina sp.]